MSELVQPYLKYISEGLTLARVCELYSTSSTCEGLTLATVCELVQYLKYISVYQGLTSYSV